MSVLVNQVWAKMKIEQFVETTFAIEKLHYYYYYYWFIFSFAIIISNFIIVEIVAFIGLTIRRFVVGVVVIKFCFVAVIRRLAILVIISKSHCLIDDQNPNNQLFTGV